MKVDISCLDEDVVELIQDWLDIPRFYPIPRKRICPFGNNIERCYICEALFPRCHKPDTACPCSEYDYKYVIRRAKEFIRLWKEERRWKEERDARRRRYRS